MRKPSSIAILVLTVLVGWWHTSFAQDEELPDRVVALQLTTEPQEISVGRSFEIHVDAAIQDRWHINSHDPGDEFAIPTVVSVSGIDGFAVGDIAYPVGETKTFEFSETPLQVYSRQARFIIPVQVTSSARLGAVKVKGTIRYQACNDRTCLPPKTIPFEFNLTVTEGKPGQGNAGNLRDFSAPASAGMVLLNQDKESGLAGTLKGRSLWFTLGFLFVMGLGLAFTPCVFPVIPVTIGFFINQAHENRLKTFLLSLMYVLGLAFTYSILGVFAALSGSLFGSALQNPYVLIGVALVILALALSMFGLYDIQVPQFILRRSGGQQGVMGALLMGLVIGFVIAPCVGPFVIALLTYVSAIGSPFTGFWMFFTLSLGLGFPFLFLGMSTGLLHRLPRSGMWMVHMKRFFGFILIGMAFYFVQPLVPEVWFWRILGAYTTFVGVTYMVITHYTFEQRGFRHANQLVAILLMVLGGYWGFTPTKEGGELKWTPFTNEEFHNATSSGRPVIVDFTAKWCVACKKLDHSTFSAPDVRETAQQFHLFRADFTDEESPLVKQLQKEFNIQGLPTVVFVDKNGNERKDLRLTGFVPPDEFLKLQRLALE